MATSKQVSLPVEAWPLLDELKAALEEDSGMSISRAAALRYAVTLAAWYMYEARAQGQPSTPRLGVLLAGIKAARLEHDNTDAVKA